MKKGTKWLFDLDRPGLSTYLVWRKDLTRAALLTSSALGFQKIDLVEVIFLTKER